MEAFHLLIELPASRADARRFRRREDALPAGGAEIAANGRNRDRFAFVGVRDNRACRAEQRTAIWMIGGARARDIEDVA